MSNSDNPINGAIFQEQVRKWFQGQYNSNFELEVKLPIGDPARDHKFDIVNKAEKIVVECKRYTWTESGNVPSAKMGFANEAAFFLSFLPDDYEKYIVMMYSFHEKRKETLAEYYYKRYRHLLGKIKVAEYNPKTEAFQIMKEENNGEKPECNIKTSYHEEELQE